ncbi:MAG: hypothetical protein B6242_10410 [Anaerolineaceae bacterium 4572_78]|nr:MAG: hypothetical protein B6242_10410 [Anaerolineaceae bacterium 4572_78]
MKSPFPGMDPYVEQAGIWNQMHLHLIAETQKFLVSLLRPKYNVAIEQLTYVTIMPPSTNGNKGDDYGIIPDTLILAPSHVIPQFDIESQGGLAVATQTAVKPFVALIPMPEEIKHRYLEIRRRKDNKVITVIEILSPANKYKGKGRDDYLKKRNDIFASRTHLVEIDLLRSAKPMTFSPNTKNDYRILVSRSWQRPEADMYLFGVRQLIPDIPIPVIYGDEEPILPLNHIIHDIYEMVSFDSFIDYNEPPTPQLSESDSKWASELIQNNLNT